MTTRNPDRAAHVAEVDKILAEMEDSSPEEYHLFQMMLDELCSFD
jgi:hypothetical protein